jgi:anti-sigma regulatory factor (Ser/Thr protein kinase)
VRFERDHTGVRATVACGGHPLPLLVRAGGTVEEAGRPGQLIGALPEVTVRDRTVALDPGDRLLLYTDGITEAVRRGRPFGQSKLADLIKQYGVGTPGELIQALRRAVAHWVSGGELRDDIALLVSQVVPDSAVQEPIRELVVPNEPARIREVRRFVGSFLADIRAPVETSFDILLAVSEAAANASRHGRRSDTWSELRVQCRLEGQDVVVSVTDEGSGFDPGGFETAQMPDRFASGGRGLFLMQQLTDEVSARTTAEGTTVTLRRRVFDGSQPTTEGSREPSPSS